MGEIAMENPKEILDEVILLVMQEEEQNRNNGKKLIQETGVGDFLEQLVLLSNLSLSQTDEKSQFFIERLIGITKESYHQRTGSFLKADEIKKITLIESDQTDPFYSLVVMITFKKIYGQEQVSLPIIIANVYPHSEVVTIQRSGLEKNLKIHPIEPKERIFRQIIHTILTGEIR